MVLGTARADKIGLVRIFSLLLLTTDGGLSDHFLAVPPLPLESHSQKTRARLHLVSQSSKEEARPCSVPWGRLGDGRWRCGAKPSVCLRELLEPAQGLLNITPLVCRLQELSQPLPAQGTPTAALLFVALLAETQIPDVPSPSCSPAPNGCRELCALAPQQGATEATEPGCAPGSSLPCAPFTLSPIQSLPRAEGCLMPWSLQQAALL